MAIVGSFSTRDTVIAVLLVATLSIFATAGRHPRVAVPPSQLVISLPLRSTYGLAMGARRPIADLQAAVQGRFTMGMDTSPTDFGYPIRWSSMSLEPLTLYGLHSLEPVWQLRNLYLDTRDRRALDLAIEIALDYRDRNPLLFPQHPNAWSEHPAANRAIAYLYLGELASEVGDLRSALLWQASLECVAFVSRRSQWVSGTNHGLFVGASIITVGIAMGREDLVSIGRSRFLQTWDRVVSEDFLLEHNPSYQMAIVELLSRLALIEADSKHADEWTRRANALRDRVKFLVSSGGQLPKFGDHRWDERYDLPGPPEYGEFWFPLAGYLGWRGRDAGVVFDLAAHSVVHSMNTVSSIAIYDGPHELGAFRTQGAYRWLCPGMEGVPEVSVAPETGAAGGRSFRIRLRYGEAVGVERIMRVSPLGIELRDRLDVPEPGQCGMAVDPRAVVVGGKLRGGVIVPEASAVVTTISLAGNPLESSTTSTADLGRFEQVRVRPFDETWAAARKLGQRIRKTGKPPAALAWALGGAVIGWGISRRTLSRARVAWVFYLCALALETISLTIVLLGAYL